MKLSSTLPASDVLRALNHVRNLISSLLAGCSEEEAKEHAAFLVEGYADRQPQGPTVPPPEDEYAPGYYWSRVEAIAAEILDEEKEAEAEGEDYDLNDRVHQEVDGDKWIIYKHLNQRVMNLGASEGYTKNPDAWDELGAESIYAKEKGRKEPPTLETIITRMAYCAMEADVMERIQERREEEEEREDAPFPEAPPS